MGTSLVYFAEDLEVLSRGATEAKKTAYVSSDACPFACHPSLTTRH
jgi:hypothetical protein